MNMHKKPLVSILTPVYNQARYIDQTIRSVLSQTYQDWEWVILDDGSTDGTGDIVRRVKDSRIRYHVQEHAGPECLARIFNNGLAFCSGDFIALLDGDDYWTHNEKLQLQVETLSDPGIVLSYGVSRVINQSGKKIGYMRIQEDSRIAHNNPVGSSLKIFLLQRYCFLPNSTVMLRKGTLDSIGGFVEAAGLTQDFPTWTRLSLEGRFAPIALCIGCWRRHILSSTFKTDSERLFDAGVDFLKDFVLRHEKKLQSLGLPYDREMLQKNWEEFRREYFQYLPYNRTMLMLQLGLFNDAKAEFRKFKEANPSAKSELIYALITIAHALKIDVVNPLAAFKSKLLGHSSNP
jgi:glycosyltransferase involved in cell wall biosynthesis